MVQDFRPARGVSGVYVIVHAPSARAYIGSAGDIAQRWYHHRGTARRGMHPNRRFQAAWAAHGEDEFRFLIVERVAGKDALRARELAWLTEGETWEPERGFNISRRSDTVGFKFTPEQRANLSATMTGRVRSPEHCAALAKAMLTRVDLEDARERMAVVGRAGKGRRKKAAHRRKIGAAQKGNLNHAAKLNDAKVVEIMWRLANGERGAHLALEYGVSDCVISNIKHGRIWQHITDTKQ